LTLNLLFKQQASSYLNDKTFSFGSKLTSNLIGSPVLQRQIWLSAVEQTVQLDSKVSDLVDYVWREAIGDLDDWFEIDLKSRLSFTRKQVDLHYPNVFFE
jgi:hypothetical protein